MTPKFADVIADSRNRVNQQLQILAAPSLGDLGASDQALHELAQACHYVVENGGKRIRPTLLYLSAAAVAGDTDNSALDYPACAMELIHTYSLVHDDLPAMDDDDLRRGKPSCHKAYGEALAILVGDALQAQAFQLLADAPQLTPEQKLAMVAALANAAGAAGMVGGQCVDINATDSDMSLSQLEFMHALKTGALIRAALALGGIAAQANPQQLRALDLYGEKIGLAFQVVDDILDVEGDTQVLGKTQGKDSAANKPTYVKLLGIEGAREQAQQLLTQALAALEDFSEAADPLRQLARYIIERKN